MATYYARHKRRMQRQAASHKRLQSERAARTSAYPAPARRVPNSASLLNAAFSGSLGHLLNTGGWTKGKRGGISKKSKTGKRVYKRK